MNIVALEQLWATKDAKTVAEHARLTALTKPEDLPKLQKKWARGEAIRQAYRHKRRALAGQPKPEKPKKPVHDAHITAVVRRIEDERTKASHQKQDAKLQAKRAAEDAKLQAKRAAKQLAEDAKIAAKRAAEDERRVQSRAVQAAKRASNRNASDLKAEPQAQAQQAQQHAQPHQIQAVLSWAQGRARNRGQAQRAEAQRAEAQRAEADAEAPKARVRFQEVEEVIG
jgi:dTMP kinase